MITIEDIKERFRQRLIENYGNIEPHDLIEIIEVAKEIGIDTAQIARLLPEVDRNINWGHIYVEKKKTLGNKNLNSNLTLELRVSVLEQELQALQALLPTMQMALETRINALELKTPYIFPYNTKSDKYVIKPERKLPPPTQAVIDIKLPEKVVQEKPGIFSKIKYAKFRSKRGFNALSLQDEPDNKCIFEILINQNGLSATYCITKNRKAQLLVLAHPDFYLKTTCFYNTSPNRSRLISTSQLGTLVLREIP